MAYILVCALDLDYDFIEQLFAISKLGLLHFVPFGLDIAFATPLDFRASVATRDNENNEKSVQRSQFPRVHGSVAFGGFQRYKCNASPSSLMHLPSLSILFSNVRIEYKV